MKLGAGLECTRLGLLCLHDTIYFHNDLQTHRPSALGRTAASELLLVDVHTEDLCIATATAVRLIKYNAFFLSLRCAA